MIYMKNVYDLRYENNLIYILPERAYADAKKIPLEVYSRTVIILYLYYMDTLSVYLGYVNNIPKDIDIYVISSRDEVLAEVRHYMKASNRHKVHYIWKQNRGRDVSALLVSSKDIVKKYEYVCFLHDKKEHLPQEKQDTDFWIANLWGNQIGSPHYIDEILRMFEKKERLGILVPPEPVGDIFTTWFGYGWHGAYDITKKIADRMALHADISSDKAPITFGTVLWFRTKALMKLFDLGWQYSDFQDEKLNDENYLSYGLERIFAYVAQDAGYETGTVMSVSYAEKQTKYLQYAASRIMHEKDDFFPISNMRKLEIYLKNRGKVIAFAKGSRELYLYGTGKMGKLCLFMLGYEYILPTGWIISKGERPGTLYGIPVFLIDEVEITQDIAVIITVENATVQEQMVLQLENKGVSNYIRFWD